MKIFIISEEVNKEKDGSAEMNKFQVYRVWPKREDTLYN